MHGRDQCWQNMQVASKISSYTKKLILFFQYTATKRSGEHIVPDYEREEALGGSSKLVEIRPRGWPNKSLHSTLCRLVRSQRSVSSSRRSSMQSLETMACRFPNSGRPPRVPGRYPRAGTAHSTHGIVLLLLLLGRFVF